MLRQFVWMLVVCAAAFCGVAGAQPFPVKPVRIVTSGVGSSNDFNARTIAQVKTRHCIQWPAVVKLPTQIAGGAMQQHAAHR